jgi:hypothetical protein
MAKPSAPVTWATDTNYASGSETGQTTRLAPSSGFKAQGFLPAEECPARYMNWCIGALADWTGYLDALPTDPDFVGVDFVWAGEHEFDDLVTFDATATFNVAPKLASSAELEYTPGRSRTVIIPLVGAVASVVPDTEFVFTSAAGGPVASVNGLKYAVPLRLPQGAIVTRVRAVLYRGHGTPGAASPTLKLYRYQVDMTTGVVTAFAAPAATLTQTLTGVFSQPPLSTGAITITIETDSSYAFEWTASDTAASTPDSLQAIEVQYTETRATGSH